MSDYVLELLAGEIRRRAPHVVPNPEDCYVYGLAGELLADGHETIRTVPTAELDARIRTNTLKATELTAELAHIAEKTPAAGQGNEGNESIPERSVTAYLPRLAELGANE